MDGTRKRTFFDALVGIGFKEIEVGFPAASAAEFEFCRRLIEEHLIPDDVTVQVLVPAREPLIDKWMIARFAPSSALKVVSIGGAPASSVRRVPRVHGILRLASRCD